MSARVLIVESLMNIAFVALNLVGYQQLATPACHGQPHSLPLDSVVLANYPCQGNVAQRLLYLLRNARLAIWDVLHLSAQERYMSLSCLGLIFNALAPLFMHADVYCQVFAPLMSYSLRSAIVTYHLAMGPNHVPSALAMSRLFESLAGFDVGGFISLMFFWRVRPSLELAHCTAMAAGLLVLSLWHRDRVPGGVNIAWQMATRAAVPAITLYLARGSRHRHLVPASDTGGGGGGGGAGTSIAADRTVIGKGKTAGHALEAEAETGTATAGRRVSSAKGEMAGDRAVEEADTHLRADEAGRATRAEAEAEVKAGGGVAADAAPPRCSAEALASATGDGDGGGDGDGSGGGAAGGVQLAPAPPPKLCATTTTTTMTTTEGGERSAERVPERVPEVSLRSAGVDGAAPRARESEAAVGPNGADSSGSLWTSQQQQQQQQQQVVVVVPEPAPGPLPRLPPYKAFVHRHSLRYKIPWAEPEQLGPGYEQRLRDLVAARGLHLAGVYVRRGCIELTLVIEERRGEEEEEEGAQAAKGLHTAADAVVAHLPAGRRAGHDDASQPPPPPPSPPRLDVAAVVVALGLMPLLTAPAPSSSPQADTPVPVAAEAGDASSALLARRLSQVQVRSWAMSEDTEGEKGEEEEGEEDGFAVSGSCRRSPGGVIALACCGISIRGGFGEGVCCCVGSAAGGGGGAGVLARPRPAGLSMAG